MAALPTLAVGGFFLDLRRWGWRGVAEDVLLAAQAMALTGALRQLTALAVRRPRPWSEGVQLSASAGGIELVGQF